MKWEFRIYWGFAIALGIAMLHFYLADRGNASPPVAAFNAGSSERGGPVVEQEKRATPSDVDATLGSVSPYTPRVFELRMKWIELRYSTLLAKLSREPKRLREVAALLSERSLGIFEGKSFIDTIHSPEDLSAFRARFETAIQSKLKTSEESNAFNSAENQLPFLNALIHLNNLLQYRDRFAPDQEIGVLSGLIIPTDDINSFGEGELRKAAMGTYEHIFSDTDVNNIKAALSPVQLDRLSFLQSLQYATQTVDRM